MIQGGCPLGNGTGNPGYSIKGEFSNNGFTNQLKHEAGVLSMARSMMPNSAGSQFFIMHKAAPHLDGEYAAFGKVIEGMDVVDSFLDVDRSLCGDVAISSPNTPIVIEKAVMIDADENGNPRAQFTMNDFKNQ